MEAAIHRGTHRTAAPLASSEVFLEDLRMFIMVNKIVFYHKSETTSMSHDMYWFVHALEYSAAPKMFSIGAPGWLSQLSV